SVQLLFECRFEDDRKRTVDVREFLAAYGIERLGVINADIRSEAIRQTFIVRPAQPIPRWDGQPEAGRQGSVMASHQPRGLIAGRKERPAVEPMSGLQREEVLQLFAVRSSGPRQAVTA